MSVSTIRLVEAWKSTNDDAKGVLYRLVLESLSPQEEMAMVIIRNAPGISSMGIAERMEINQNHVGTILKRLYTWGLVSRNYNDGGWFDWMIKWEVK